MKMKNMWKRFWTLDVHNHAGFTLVELIIVIAILAILSTGAIAGYSAYITSANKTADQAMIAEIKNVLLLDQYASNGNAAGYVIVYSDGTVADASESVVPALKDAYGANWDNALALKYTEWKHNNPMTTAFTQQYNPATVGSSSFMKSSTSELLAHVSDLTGAAIGYLDGNESEKYNLMLHNLFNNDADAMKKTCNQFGIDFATDSDGNTVFADNVTSEQLSNLLVLGTANQLASENAADSPVAGLALQYAGYVAFANANPNNEAIQNAFNTMSEELKKGNASALNSFENDPAISEEWDNYANGENNTQYLTDLEAFASIMEAVDDMSSNLTADDIADGGFFASEKVNAYFDNYVASAAAVGNMSEQDMSKIKDALKIDGCILILLTSDGQVLCSSTDISA